MTSMLAQTCGMHDGAKVMYAEDEGKKICPLCEAERKLALMREVLSQTED